MNKIVENSKKINRANYEQLYGGPPPVLWKTKSDTAVVKAKAKSIFELRRDLRKIKTTKPAQTSINETKGSQLVTQLESNDVCRLLQGDMD